MTNEECQQLAEVLRGIRRKKLIGIYPILAIAAFCRDHSPSPKDFDTTAWKKYITER